MKRRILNRIFVFLLCFSIVAQVVAQSPPDVGMQYNNSHTPSVNNHKPLPNEIDGEMRFTQKYGDNWKIDADKLGIARKLHGYYSLRENVSNGTVAKSSAI